MIEIGHSGGPNVSSFPQPINDTVYRGFGVRRHLRAKNTEQSIFITVLGAAFQFDPTRPLEVSP